MEYKKEHIEMKKRKRKRLQWLTQHYVFLALPHDSRAAEEGGGGGRRDSCPPSHGAGGASISFAPPPEILKGLHGKTVENARNSITPNIPLVETGQVRKIGAPRLPKGALPIQGPPHIGLPHPHSKIPSAATAMTTPVSNWVTRR